MKYFIDCEYFEGFAKPISFLPGIWWNKPVYVVVPLSIGIVSEDGREYEAYNIDFDRYDDNFLKKEIKPNLPPKEIEVSSEVNTFSDIFNFDSSYRLPVMQPNPIYKKLDVIKNDILRFIGDDEDPEFVMWYGLTDMMCLRIIFGGFINWPKRYGQTFKSLEDAEKIAIDLYYDFAIARTTPIDKKAWFRSRYSYPKNQNPHNALSDARWNRDLCVYLDGILKKVSASLAN